MSGGVDSSVAAALLKEAGFDVIGVFMKLDKLKSSKENKQKAMTVARKLSFSFKVLDFRKEFKKKVIDYFLKEYKSGRTPNPCVVCNKKIKHQLLFNKLSQFRADFLATGHYIRVKNGKLLKGKDKNKDQSYFLWQLTPKLLNKVLFPVGGYTKKEVKQLARNFKLPTKDISESQEICFVQTKINDFLKRYLGENPGKIVDVQNKIIGQHRGLHFYTIGQRKGINLPSGPFYVLGKDLKKNLLIVTKNKKDLFKKELIAKDVNWISGKIPKFPLKVKAKIRYKHKLALAVVTRQRDGRIKVVFSKPQRAITPGQSVVFYKGEELLGGAMIK